MVEKRIISKFVTKPVEPKLEPVSSMGGLLVQTYNIVEGIPSKIVFPDKTNTGNSIGLLIVWKRVADLAEKKYKMLVENLVEGGLIKDYRQMDTPGTYQIAKSGSMTLSVNVSVPRKEFNLDWFSKALEDQYGVPIATTKMLFEQAKQPTGAKAKRLTPMEGETECP